MSFSHGSTKSASVYIGIDPSNYDNDKHNRKKSWYRLWRQLSRTQKVLFLMMVLSGISFLYVFLHKTRVSTKEMENGDYEDKSLEILPIKDPRKPKLDREKYMEKIHRELDEKIKPMKRGPPKLDNPNVYSKTNSEDSTTKSKSKEYIESIEKEKERNRKKVEQIKSPINNDHPINRIFPGKNADKNHGDKGKKGKSDNDNGGDFKEYKIINGERDDILKEKNRLKKLNAADPSADFAHNPEKIPQTTRQKEVVKAMEHAWMGYEKYAWGHDELRPIAKTHSEWFMLGLTIVDSLDTLWIMNMKSQYQKARDWVDTELTFDKPVTVNLFETTIRVLGGLLSIYHLSADPMYLHKAVDLGDRLMGGFSSRSKIPYSDVNLRNKAGRPPAWGPDSSLAEVATIQLEFTDLSHSITNPKYKSAVDNVMLQIFSLNRNSGLAPIYINADSGEFRPGSHITLGARGDSYYEYLLKSWIQGGKQDDHLKKEYLTAMDGVMKLLVRKSEPNKLTYVGELLNGRNFSPKMDHLVCFLPGTLALGYKNGLPESHLQLAKELMETCYQMYAQMATGLSPEIAYFNEAPSREKDIIVKAADAHNLLRPETVESLHVMYEITGDKKYQEYGWNILQAFNKYCRVKTGGYVSLNDVRNGDNPRPGEGRDKMESFFLGETLKYLYLLFSDVTILPLDKFVFNTEAHPLPVSQ